MNTASELHLRPLGSFWNRYCLASFLALASLTWTAAFWNLLHTSILSSFWNIQYPTLKPFLGIYEPSGTLCLQGGAAQLSPKLELDKAKKFGLSVWHGVASRVSVCVCVIMRHRIRLCVAADYCRGRLQDHLGLKSTQKNKNNQKQPGNLFFPFLSMESLAALSERLQIFGSGCPAQTQSFQAA